jgi:D-arginine dehydrogenase
MHYDVAIIGAGIAGASLAAELAPHISVLLLEAEEQPGYHATGRSAAFWTESYGGSGVQPLSAVSGPWLAKPPPGFSDRGFLAPRSALHLGRAQDDKRFAAFAAEFTALGVSLEPLVGAALDARLPDRHPAWDRGLWEASCADIDVAAFHAACLRVARRSGAVIATSRPFRESCRANGRWILGSDSANLIVNAAGAWADDVARLVGVQPIGIQPLRRSIARVRVTGEVPPDLPLVIDINERFYFKPDSGGRLWLSPHDETPSTPCDAAPEEVDIATAISLFEQVMSWRVEAVEHAWAGLRSFAPDRLPVYGFDPAVPDFFWFAGQGGFGIQTAPAAAKIAAALVLANAPEAMVSSIDVKRYAPDRFRK